MTREEQIRKCKNIQEAIDESFANGFKIGILLGIIVFLIMWGIYFISNI